MNRFFMVIVFVLFIGAMGTNAEIENNSKDNPKHIPDSIIVSADRYPTNSANNANSITVITENEIKASKADMVSELLRSVPGLDIVQSGGLGKQTSVFMRGTNSNHTLVIIDGVEMNNPSSPTTSFDFAHLNVNNIQRIEILRGSHSILYGSEAIGGVINIFTKRGFGKDKIEISSQAGRYDSYFESLHLSGSQSIADYSFYLSRKDSKGFSTINKTNGGIEKDGYENTEISLNTGIQLSKNLELIITNRIINTTADIDKSFGIFDDPNNTTQTKVRTSSATIKTLKNSNYLNPIVHLSLSNQKLINKDEIDIDHGSDRSELNSESNKLKLSLLNQLNIIPANRAQIGIEYEKEDYKSDFESVSFFGPFNDTVQKINADIFSIYAVDKQSYKNFNFSIGARYDNHENFGSELTYRFTSLYILPNNRTKFKSSISSGFKTPSLYQLNDPSYGNDKLKPEESTSWELGFSHSTDDNQLHYGATYFSLDLKNLIGFNESFVSINIGEAESEGVESFVELNFTNSKARLDYTYTETKDITTGDPIIRRPKHKFVYTLNHIISNRITTGLSMQTVGNRFDKDFSTGNFIVLEGYTLVNFVIDYQLHSNVIIISKIENLFDKQYTEVYSYNTSGRNISAGFRVAL